MGNIHEKTDVILIGAGVMSATLGTFLKELAPDWEITVFEQLASAGEESSNEWNNAGTGHAALCELNYTSEKSDGSVDITKAVKINEQFQVSRQFWSYLVTKGIIEKPSDFIQPIPHMSIVQGEDNIKFLKKRFEALTAHPLFQGMMYSENHETLTQWIPLMMENRSENERIAATKIDSGTDVNFGSLTRILMDYLEKNHVKVRYEHTVRDITRNEEGLWHVKVRNDLTGEVHHYFSKFLFIGAGGYS
ncbi:MAG: FAD-dependent oxidoreductase, partial [Bacilli bacterium]